MADEPLSGPIGILHPGAMGASVAAALAGQGHRVLWASEGRSEASRTRAAAADLDDGGTVERLASECGLLVSICPPDAAMALATRVSSAGFRGAYLDANAVAPARARAIGEAVRAGGAKALIDGGIVGPPAWKVGSTRLFLSGDAAEDIAALFAGSPLEAIAIAVEPGAASALKMAYAAYTKGTSALLAAILALAEREGIAEPLRAEWERSQPDLAAGAEARALGSAVKAWRFAGEMEEIADTFAAATLPDGFHRAAAEVFRRMAEFKDVPEPPALEAALAALLREPAQASR